MNSFKHFAIYALVGLTSIVLSEACGDDSGGGDKPPSETGGCGTSDACGAGTVCLNGACIDGSEHALSLDSRARGCEVTLADTEDAKWAGATFGKDLKGSFVQRAPNVGLSVIASEDTAMPGDQTKLAYAGSGTPKVVKSRCVDSKGKWLKDVAVSVQ